MSAFEERELKKLADSLAMLTPRPAHIDRDGILYEAGRRSVRPSRFWPLATMAVSIVACVLALALIFRPGPRTIVHYIQTPAQTTPTSPTDVQAAPGVDSRVPALDEAKEPKSSSSAADKSSKE